MVKIRFIAQGANAMIGDFGTGDIANVSDALARHMVSEARVAEYVQAAAEPPPFRAASHPTKRRPRLDASASKDGE